MTSAENQTSPYLNISLVSVVLLLNLLSSCVAQREIEYLHKKDKNVKAYTEAEFPDYRLKPNDELYIQISSLDEAAANVFSNAPQQTSYVASINPYGASLLSYSIDKEGYLLLPLIGKILVKDKTLSEVSVIVTNSMNHILNQPVVSVKLVNRYVSVLGEVRVPGHYPISQEKLTIFDALSLAGDITNYGNRDKVILIRNENGENTIANLNIHKAEILSSGFYYLRPNDIVYVKPLRGNKFWELHQIQFTLLFSAITTGLLIYEIVKGL